MRSVGSLRKKDGSTTRSSAIEKSYVNKKNWNIRRLKRSTSKQPRSIATWPRDAKKRKKKSDWPRSAARKNVKTT